MTLSEILKNDRYHLKGRNGKNLIYKDNQNGKYKKLETRYSKEYIEKNFFYLTEYNSVSECKSANS